MSGKRAFLDLLKQEGVEIMFGNPGTTELPLMDAFATENELRYLLGLQEAAVMAMADGYAQASGKLAVVNLHVAPGLGNAMGMLYDAQKAGSPILVTAGQHEQSFNATEPILWADLPTIARPLVKWSSEVHRLADLPRLVHRAAKTALAPPTGPVFLSLPGDILRADADIDLSAPTRVAPRLRGDRAAVEAAADLLAQAQRPVIMAGDAVAQSRAHAELVELAELLGAPVYTEFVPNTASFPGSHPLFRGSMVRLAPEVRKVLEQYDVLFSVGADLFTLSLPSDVDPMPATIKLIHLDVDPWELGKNYPPAVAILGDPKGTLPEIVAAVRERMTSGARAAGRELPDRPVLGPIGDGSAMYTCQALWTAAHYRIGAVFVILNNSSYRILKQRLHGMRGLAEQTDSYVGMELLDPQIDFVSLARSLGVAAERAKTVHETTDLIAHAFNADEPMLIDVELDRAFKPMCLAPVPRARCDPPLYGRPSHVPACGLRSCHSRFWRSLLVTASLCPECSMRS